MKSLIRWGTALSLVGGILFNPLAIGGDLRALALTNEQVVETVTASSSLYFFRWRSQLFSDSPQ